MAKKYIDADKLKAEIERYGNTAIDAYNPLGGDADFWQGKVVACEDLKTLVTSLQQEQPAKRGYKDCNGCEYNRPLKDQIGWQFRGCFGGDYKGKPIAEIELCPLKVAQQEQPSEELEKAAEEYATTHLRNNEFPTADNAFIAGAEWQKQQMLKDAVEGKVCKDHIVTEKPFYFYQSRLIELPDNLKEGDKVKIVIVKED